MPTPKQVSRIKAEWIHRRRDAISADLKSIQEDIYREIAPDFISLAKDNGKSFTRAQVLQIEKKARNAIKERFPEVVKKTVKDAKTIGDLNLMYFSTMMDSNQLDKIRATAAKVIDKKLGIDQAGKAKANGFVAKALDTQKAQKDFVAQTRKLLTSGADIQLLKDKLREFITGSENKSGFLQAHFNTFASDLLITIDRNNSGIFADELGLTYFYFAGGLIKTSREFCIERNGKIFTRDQAESWRDNSLITAMYGKNINDYEPLLDMGGYGCLHSPDWITSELAKGIIRDQNVKASDRNTRFKERYGL